MNQIQAQFNELYDCIVRNLQYDYLNAKFILELEDLETGKTHAVIFNDVDSCLFTMTGVEGEICKNIFPEVFAILPISITVKTNNKWLSAYPLRYNIGLEIMDRAILINARSVQVDSQLFIEPFTE